MSTVIGPITVLFTAEIVLVDEETLKLKAKASLAKPPSRSDPNVTKSRSAEYNTLKLGEGESETAEF